MDLRAIGRIPVFTGDDQPGSWKSQTLERSQQQIQSLVFVNFAKKQDELFFYIKAQTIPRLQRSYARHRHLLVQSKGCEVNPVLRNAKFLDQLLPGTAGMHQKHIRNLINPVIDPPKEPAVSAAVRENVVNGVNITAREQPEAPIQNQSLPKNQFVAENASEMNGGPAMTKQQEKQPDIIAHKVGKFDYEGPLRIQTAPEVDVWNPRSRQPWRCFIARNNTQFQAVRRQALYKAHGEVGFKTTGDDDIHAKFGQLPEETISARSTTSSSSPVSMGRGAAPPRTWGTFQMTIINTSQR